MWLSKFLNITIQFKNCLLIYHGGPSNSGTGFDNPPWRIYEVANIILGQTGTINMEIFIFILTGRFKHILITFFKVYVYLHMFNDGLIIPALCTQRQELQTCEVC